MTKSLSSSGTRRGIVRLLAALPLGVTLASVLGAEPDATAQKDPGRGSAHRHHRRRARNRHRPGNDKDHRKGKDKDTGKNNGKGNGKDKGRGKPKRDTPADQQPPPGPTGGGGCTSQPKSLTCAGLCGMTKDNCGREVDCGQCGNDPVCPSPHFSTTCNGRCGLVTDSCGRQVDCGDTCSGVETCGGGGSSNICGCTSQEQQATCGRRCGAVTDNCGHEVDCGPCVCTSVPWAVTCDGKCGVVRDNCGREVNCGNTCSGVETCGGAGVSNHCGCTSQPKSVTCERTCGEVLTDNCGRKVVCDPCGDGGCFIGGTRVRMADGSDKAIELVQPGDRVLGRGGRINRVRGILYPLLGDRPLYALNGGTAFVTASHPFLTSDGWKAVDPDAARAEVPELQIGQLTVGDVLVAVTSSEPAGRNAGDRTTEELSVPLQSLEGRPADAATQLYNLDVDGDDTYVANGLVVHNKVW